MAKGKGCSRCSVRTHTEEEHKGCLGHHQPNCPEMFFAGGAPRGVTPPAELARLGKLGSAMTLQDELAEIFAVSPLVSEEVPDGQAEA